MKNEAIKKLLQELRDKEPGAFSLDSRIATIKSKEDFADFVEALMRERAELLSGLAASQFLEELAVFVRGLDGYFEVSGKALPVKPEWNVFADILVAATIRAG